MYLMANKRIFIKVISLFTILLLLLSTSLIITNSSVNAVLAERSITVSDSEPSATNVDYNLSFNVDTGINLGSIVITFCQNTPLPNDVCNIPSGFNASGVQLSSQSGETGFTISGQSSINSIILSRTPSMTSGGLLTYDLSNITNPSTVDEYYARVYLYSSDSGTGNYVDFGGIALDITNSLGLSSEVPPFLELCAAQSIEGYDCSTGTSLYIDMGEFNYSRPVTSTSQFVVATNAIGGLIISVSGNTLTSGNDILWRCYTKRINTWIQSQFGLNLAANTDPAVGRCQ